ncbi:MAG: hypothetical protein NWE91_04140 [Candidatus Bathyarchaeota archaeon]|nr:hypothetical protein [Candidatus Bathyarchaeota archaeon]
MEDSYVVILCLAFPRLSIQSKKEDKRPHLRLRKQEADVNVEQETDKTRDQ